MKKKTPQSASQKSAAHAAQKERNTKQQRITSGKVGSPRGESCGDWRRAHTFPGPDGKKHLRHAKSWAIQMKGDVVEKLEAAREMSEPVYHTIIDSVAKEYSKDGKVGREEILALAADLKKHWKTISATAHAAKKCRNQNRFTGDEDGEKSFQESDRA